jgi:hypothetical protein
MKFHVTIFSIAVGFIGLIVWKYNRHVQRPLVDDVELEEQLTTSTPNESSTLSLRTVFDKITSSHDTDLNSEADSKKPSFDSTLDVNREIYGGNRKDIAAISARKFSRIEAEMGQKYFEELIQTPQTAKLYERSQKFFGSSPQGEGAAKWVTLGVVFESSARYGNALEMAMQEANRNADSVLESISQSIDSIRRDPFIYQMTMNLVYKLDSAPEKQAEFYGQELEQQLKQLSAQPTDSFWVSTLGLMLAQQAGVKGDALFPYLKRGLQNSKGSPQVLAEFKQSALFYFPGMNL